MKLIVVKCPKNKRVQVEDNGTGGALCPEHCPLKQSSRCFNNTFRYSKPMSSLVKPDIEYRAPGAAAAAQPSPTVREAHPTREESNARDEAPAVSSAANTESTSESTAVESNTSHGGRSSFSSFDFLGGAGAEELTDLYADDSSTISYSPFDAFAGGGRAEPAPKRAESRSTIDKYSSFAISDTSIFSSVRQRDDDEPCFTDGALSFYDKVPSGAYSHGNSRAAMTYIFNHWYVSRVFEDSLDSYTEDFLYLLSVLGFRNREDKLREIVDDVKLDGNQKFFRVFYTIVYKNQLSGFYWNDGDSPFKQILPRFSSVNDFYVKLARAQEPNDFLSVYDGCLDELIYYVSSGKYLDNGRAWFRKSLTQQISSRQNRILYVTDNEGRISINNLGEISDIVKRMSRPDSLSNLRALYNFLCDFKISSTYDLVPRGESDRLVLSEGSIEEDDGIYDILGVSDYGLSQCASVYNYYATVLREYVNTFKPKEISFKGVSFTAHGFFGEILSVISNAGAYTLTANYREYDAFKIFETVRSLYSRGVFDYYESINETRELSRIKSEIINKSNFSIDMYFSEKRLDHKLYSDGELISVSEYIDGLVSGDAPSILGVIGAVESGGGRVLRAYLDANVKDKEFALVKENIERLLKSERQLLAE